MSTPPPIPTSPDRRHPAPWVRSVLGDRLSARSELRRIPLSGHVSLMWWALGLTPTARRRGHLFREAIGDNRGVRYALGRARGYAAL